MELNFPAMNDEFTYIPFIQVKLEQIDVNTGSMTMSSYPTFQLEIQEIKIEIDTGTLNEVLKLVTKISTVLGSETTEYLSA